MHFRPSTTSMAVSMEPSTDLEKGVAAILKSSLAAEDATKTLTQAEQLALKGTIKHVFVFLIVIRVFLLKP